MDILRIATAGSVDDGKSTLIGRLLYETRSVPQDRLAAVDAASKRRGVDFLDLSLLTDGLIAEREQGITIDVAHVYFSTPRRKYIIADTPGHFEYTRNMVTGASKASVSIILIDARNGIVEQTARHYAIACMLRIPTVIVCVNKMDLTGYDQARFEAIVDQFRTQFAIMRPALQQLHFLPASSLHGENITQASTHMPWYGGPTLLDLLETAEAHHQRHFPSRLQVQTVIRPRTEALHDYRGYAGRVASGGFSIGDAVQVLPNARASRITGIERFGRLVQRAEAGDSVTVLLADDIDISRGCTLAPVDQAPQPRKEIRAKLCWLDHTPLESGRMYVLQHGVNRVRARLAQITTVIDVTTQRASANPAQLKLNEIGEATLRLAQPIFADAYADNPANGAFILIDEWSNTTAGVGFVEA
jgi:sulfate adenylyltransferase subunit 1